MSGMSGMIGYAERPRAGGWTLRSALVRYAQPEPARASAVLELVRRTDLALKPYADLLERSPELLAAAVSRAPYADVPIDRSTDLPDQRDEEQRAAYGLLVAAVGLDRLGDVLARWARTRSDQRPDAEVDGIAREVFRVLGDLGVAREARPPRRS
jgi:hypothetical protein